MPIDPSIYGTIRPVAPIQATNPLELIQAGAQIANVREQTELRRLAGEKARQAAADEAQVRSVFASTDDVDEAIARLYKVNPRAAGPIAEQVGKARKETLDAAGKDIDNQKNLLAHYHNIYAMVNDQASNDAIRPLFVKAFPHLDAVLPKEYGDGSGVQAVNEAVISQKDKLDAKQKAIEFWAKGDTRNSLATMYSRVDPNAPDAPQQWAQIGTTARAMGAKQAELDVFGPYDPSAPARAAKLGISPKEQADLDAQAARDAATAANQAALREQGAHSPIYKEWQDYHSSGGTLPFDAYQTMDANRRRSVTQINTGTTPVPGDFARTGEAFLDTIPAQWRATVKKIANYDEDPTKVTSMRGGMRETVMQWVNQVNPAYDASVFSNRAPTRKAFTTGTQGRQINNINTAIGHIDQLTGLADQLQTGGFVPANQAWNAIRTAFGSDKVTNFNTLKDALAGEVAGVLSQSGATVSGIADAQAKIQAANSPTQLAGYVKTLIPVMGSKLGSLDYQYHQAMGADDPFSALSPESRRILTKHGVDPAHLTGGDSAPASGGGGGGGLTFQDYLKSKGKR